MSRAVPRHQRDVSVEKGDIQSLSTGNNCVFACTTDGSIQCVVHMSVPTFKLTAAGSPCLMQPCASWLADACRLMLPQQSAARSSVAHPLMH